MTAPETTAVGLQWRRSDEHWVAGEFQVAPCNGGYLLLRDGWVCRQFGRLTDAFDAAERLAAREKVTP